MGNQNPEKVNWLLTGERLVDSQLPPYLTGSKQVLKFSEQLAGKTIKMCQNKSDK